MADGKGTITGMIKGADSTPKVYGNNANHPGHTTAAFNKQKAGAPQHRYQVDTPAGPMTTTNPNVEGATDIGPAPVKGDPSHTPE